MGGYVAARLLATAAFWVRIQTSLKKSKMGDISRKSSQHTLARQKNIQKICLKNIK